MKTFSALSESFGDMLEPRLDSVAVRILNFASRCNSRLDAYLVFLCGREQMLARTTYLGIQQDSASVGVPLQVTGSSTMERL